jgi:hypothetical protein
MNWIMIVYIFANGGAMTSVPGFTSIDACMVAAAKVEKTMGSIGTVRISCVADTVAPLLPK